MQRFTYWRKKMAKLSKSNVKAPSKSEVKAAILKSLARSEPQPTIQLIRLPRRDLGQRLASGFSGAGIDISELEKIASREREEFARLEKKLKQHHEKQNSALAKQYKATLENKKRALQAIAGQTIGVQTEVVHTASDIVDSNSAKKIITDKHLSFYVNWAKCVHTSSGETYGDNVGVKFIFAWANRSKNRLVVRANADVIISGFVEAYAASDFFRGGQASIWLDARLIAYPGAGGPGVWGTPVGILEMSADASAGIWGGDSDKQWADLFEVRNVTLNHLLVGPRQIVIFHVWVGFFYQVFNPTSWAHMEFKAGDRNVTCPALVLEYGVVPPPVGPG
jgi:hypothetical protein